MVADRENRDRQRKTRQETEKMELKQITATDLQALADSRIVNIQGISGVPTTVDIAKAAPGLVQMHSLSGQTYDIVAYIAELDTFNVERAD